MISTQYINLNMVPSGVMPVLHCSQYDVGRPLGVVIYNGSESVDLSGYTVTIEGTRTDRTPVTAGVTTDGNIGVFTTTPTMTNENDTYRAKVVLTDNAGRVSSLAFVMCVDEKTMDENAEEIEEDASLYQQYTGTVQTIIAQIRGDLAAEITARQNAVSAEATARQNAISAEASARQAADNTLQSNINAEASARATEDASLQSQINQLIAPSGSAPSAAEVENARIGADGVTYPTLGDAIRTNDSALKSALWQNIRELDDGKRIFEMVWGNIAPDGTINYNYTPKVRVVNYTYEKFDKSTVLSLASGYGLILALYDDSYALISRIIYAAGNVITVPANTYFRVCVYHGTIVPSSIADLADKVTYTSDIQTKIADALTAALAITNSGVTLTLVTDLNTVAATVMGGDSRVGIYRYASSAENIPTSSSGAVIIYRAGTLYQTQLALPITGGAYIRNRLNGTWSGWTNLSSDSSGGDRLVVKVEKDGSGDYTKLVDAINAATQVMDAVVYVGAGTWDICDELGEDYLNAVSSTHGTRGPYLKNRVHLIFASNSKVVCNYTGTREDTMRWLSPFNAGQYGFTLENANIEASNVRYCVHDERDTDTDAYINKYINCRMHLDNSTNTVIRTCNPIGGGLGKDGYVEIDGCWFKGERTYVYTENLPLVTYHNSAAAGAKSYISLKNSYFADDGRPRFNWYGQSQLITNVEVCGCSMGSIILSQAETTDGSSPYQNISIIEWNNTVRT